MAAAGAQFIHADVRHAGDMQELPEFDLLIDAAAEPSVQAGIHSSPRYVLETNLTGTMNALEIARQRNAAFVLLSTSRVYSIEALNSLPYEESETRLQWRFPTGETGAGEQGIAEGFSTAPPRSYYGTTKLASEHLVQEYAAQTGMPAIINRCGVLAGPWQMGKTDQGVVSLWAAHHHFQRPLSYIGFGGTGKQVRDVLHIDDLFDLLARQIENIANWQGDIYNVGGGPTGAVSLAELTELCQRATGNRIEIGAIEQTSPVDVRIYITDNTRVSQAYGWQPRRSVETIVADIAGWLNARGAQLKPLLGT